jgi:two-component system, NarL family, sensor histidine kinase DesK
VLAIPLGLGVLALQLRHSFAIARGRRPRGALWSLLALAVLVYLPILWLGWGWVPMQASLMASMPLALRGRPLAIALAVPVLGTDLAVIRLFADRPAATVAYLVVEQTFTLVVLPAALYASARLVLVLQELHATRAELAELAVGRERSGSTVIYTTCSARASRRSRSRASWRSGCWAATRRPPGPRSRA